MGPPLWLCLSLLILLNSDLNLAYSGYGEGSPITGENTSDYQNDMAIARNNSGNGDASKCSRNCTVSPSPSPLRNLHSNCTLLVLKPSNYVLSDSEGFVEVGGEVLPVFSWDESGRPVVCRNAGFDDHGPTRMNNTSPSDLLIYFSNRPLLYVTFSLSTLGCLLILVTYFIFQDLQTLPGQILMNLAVVFLVGDLLAVAVQPAIAASRNTAVCIVLTFMFCFFVLARFSWTVAMALEVAHTLTYVFRMSSVSTQRAKRRLLFVYLIAAWGTPMVSMATVVSVHLMARDLFVYRSEEEEVGASICWFKPKVELIVFGTHAAVSILFSFLAFVWILGTLCWIRASNSSEGIPNRLYIRVYVAIFIIAGLTRLLGFGISHSKWILYLFVIVNRTQAFFIGLVFVCTKRVLKLYLQLFRSFKQRINCGRVGRSTRVVPVQVGNNHPNTGLGQVRMQALREPHSPNTAQRIQRWDSTREVLETPGITLDIVASSQTVGQVAVTTSVGNTPPENRPMELSQIVGSSVDDATSPSSVGTIMVAWN